MEEKINILKTDSASVSESKESDRLKVLFRHIFSEKIYIFYDQIENISIQEDKIFVDCKIEESWGQKNQHGWKCWRYEIQVVLH